MDETELAALTPRARRRRARLSAILDAAMELLITEGLDGLTIHRLAKAVDYTPGALYHYFDSKEAIITELQVQIFSEIHELFKAVWAVCDQVAEEGGVDAEVASLMKVLATADFYISLSDHKPQRFGMISVAMGEPRLLLGDDSVPPVAAAVMGVLGDVGAVVAQAVASGALTEMEKSPQRAVTLWSSLHGVLLLRKFSRFDKNLIQSEVLAKTFSRDLMLAWGAKASTIEAAENVLGTFLAGRTMYSLALEFMESE
jgi:AcrR family transcriptional regulator